MCCSFGRLPSGHTATAFMTATLMSKEYGENHLWYRVGLICLFFHRCPAIAFMAFMFCVEVRAVAALCSTFAMNLKCKCYDDVKFLSDYGDSDR